MEEFLMMILQSGITFLHDLHLTFFELLTILGFLAGIVGIWVGVKVKIAKLETNTQLELKNMRAEFDIKLKAIDSKTTGLAEFLGIRLSEFVTLNKEDHTELKENIAHITNVVNEINIKVARLAS